ncbi:MAG: hypothetical protein Q9218_002854 [Villophora microphyllina]
MFSNTLILSLLCALSVKAAAPARPPPGSDQCGPTVQNVNTGDPKDSCKSVPPMVNSTTPFGITTSIDSGPGVREYDWDTCNPVIDLICDMMKDTNSSKNAESGPVGSSDDMQYAPCSMGFYIPDIDGAAGKPPQTKDNDQCTRIFTAMVDAARNVSGKAIGGSGSRLTLSMVLGTSINLEKNPANPPSPIQLPGGDGTGAANNSGYLSYVMAYDPNWNPPHIDWASKNFTGSKPGKS